VKVYPSPKTGLPKTKDSHEQNLNIQLYKNEKKNCIFSIQLVIAQSQLLRD